MKRILWIVGLPLSLAVYMLFAVLIAVAFFGAMVVGTIQRLWALGEVGRKLREVQRDLGWKGRRVPTRI